MIHDLPRLAAFLIFVIFASFGGAFLYSILNHRLIKKSSWIISIGSAFGWMILYALFATAIADLGVVALRSHPYVSTGIGILIIIFPYIAAIRLYLRYRKTEQGAAANP